MHAGCGKVYIMKKKQVPGSKDMDSEFKLLLNELNSDLLDKKSVVTLSSIRER